MTNIHRKFIPKLTEYESVCVFFQCIRALVAVRFRHRLLRRNDCDVVADCSSETESTEPGTLSYSGCCVLSSLDYN